MSKFVVETYTPRETTNILAARINHFARAADQISEPGTEVRLLGAILLPQDETCLYLYRSSTADAVREAAACARLRFERITEAVSITRAQARARTRRPTSPARPTNHTIT